MKFKFSYEKLLEHYHNLEEVARRDYNETMGRLEAEKKIYNSMWDDFDKANDQLFESRTSDKGVSVATLEHLTLYMDGQKIRIAKQREVVMNHTSIVEQKQEILIAAVKERKTMEKLKEKKLKEFKKAQKKQEAKENDELVVTRFKAGER